MKEKPQRPQLMHWILLCGDQYRTKQLERLYLTSLPATFIDMNEFSVHVSPGSRRSWVNRLAAALLQRQGRRKDWERIKVWKVREVRDFFGLQPIIYTFILRSEILPSHTRTRHSCSLECGLLDMTHKLPHAWYAKVPCFLYTPFGCFHLSDQKAT
jgi:hypothetical protein